MPGLCHCTGTHRGAIVPAHTQGWRLGRGGVAPGLQSVGDLGGRADTVSRAIRDKAIVGCRADCKDAVVTLYFCLSAILSHCSLDFASLLGVGGR